MEQQEKKSIFKKWWFWVIAVVAFIIVINSLNESVKKSQTVSDTSIPVVNKPVVLPFSSEARTRFDGILANSPELTSISCESDDCSYVVYFNYKKIPDDVEYVIRGNTATFSKFKKDKTGVSHVSIAARFNDDVFFGCSGANGVVEKCQNYKN
jgi:hypothetical protein